MSAPLILEVHARCWLQELSEQQGRPINLANVPPEELREWQGLGFTHLWLMGVWTTGPRSREVALQTTGLREALDRALPGWAPEDVPGSPFAIAEYRVPRSLGGEAGLAQFRQQLHEHGIKLILDFVPNHVGLDHHWLEEQLECFVQSPEPLPGFFEHTTPSGKRWVAHGKDPNFPPWIDTAQLDYRRVEAQRAVAEAFQSVARRCDGIRCDMAMLVLRDVFERNWQHTPAPEIPAEGEFWVNLIRRVKRSQPDLLLLAEAYWDLEARLQTLGFDYTYDKRLYDYLMWRDPEAIRQHVIGVSARFMSASAHFLENHDEPRVAGILPFPEHRVAALLMLGMPGMRLVHEGQMDGARNRIPVHLARRAPEPIDQEVQAFYQHLLRALPTTSVGRGRGQLLQTRSAWPENTSHRYLLVFQWRSVEDAFDLVVVNLVGHRSQAYAELNLTDLGQRNWRMNDLLGSEEYLRYGEDLQQQGLYLDVAPHAAQLFHFTPVE